MKSLLTIKEFAMLHNVNTRTLHYYDEVNVFSPTETGANDYRYYSYLQSPEFEMILAFRELGMSINEIKQYQSNRSNGTFSLLLKSKQSEVDDKIRQLKQIKAVLKEKEDQLNLANSERLHEIEIVSLKDEYLILTKMYEDYHQKDAYNMIQQIEQQSGETKRLFNTSYGSMLSEKNIMMGNFEDYEYLFAKIKNPKFKKKLFLKPKGDYIRTYCKGDWGNIPKTYHKILDFAKEHNLRLAGYAYEQGLNEMAISSMEEYVTQITIKCDKADFYALI
ncbi:MAG: MerR family transcriptional regulator [Lachnospiraceae bacterium]|nr:MerR family transcriptional regulator [Lachnospiraceae bacterium]